MLLPSRFQLEPSNSRTRVPAGGIDLIASIDFGSDESTTVTLSSSSKVSQGYDAISRAEVATPNHSNQQYSIYAITNAAANIAERYAYTAYGQPTILNAAASVIAASAISNRYTYTSREWDATVGLHHFRARWMSGLTGRFLTRDPIGYEGSPSNLYQFLKARALVDRDPSGLCVEANEEPEPIGFGCVVLYYSVDNNAQCLASCAHRSNCCRIRGNLMCAIYAHRICPRGLRGQACRNMETARCLNLYIPACTADENYCRAWCNSSYPN